MTRRVEREGAAGKVLGNFFLLPRGEAVLTKVAELVAVERDVAARWAKIVPTCTKHFAKCVARLPGPRHGTSSVTIKSRAA